MAECVKPAKGRSWCSMHLARWYRTGTTDPGPLALPPEQRFWRSVQKTETCWLWTGSIGSSGYGQLAVDGATLYAHRYAWTLANQQPIPDGMHVDHKCFVRACVNPDHLQAVTHTENAQNHNGPRRNNRLGVRGVHWFAPMKKYRVTATHDGTTLVAYYADLHDAEDAAIDMRNQLHTNNLVDRA